MFEFEKTNDYIFMQSRMGKGVWEGVRWMTKKRKGKDDWLGGC